MDLHISLRFYNKSNILLRSTVASTASTAPAAYLSYGREDKLRATYLAIFLHAVSICPEINLFFAKCYARTRKESSGKAKPTTALKHEFHIPLLSAQLSSESKKGEKTDFQPELSAATKTFFVNL